MIHQQKDLKAARKAGTAPAERDEEGNEINPHILQTVYRKSTLVSWYQCINPEA
ncbi:mRNA splicing protein [Basidiobolus ranarum]|uniref:mRNA splicing protein n=1 Tax=Basidiobolus ranarum TaxID=34480 RepID=A0ABR2W8E5_9FUNG